MAEIAALVSLARNDKDIPQEIAALVASLAMTRLPVIARARRPAAIPYMEQVRLLYL